MSKPKKVAILTAGGLAPASTRPLAASSNAIPKSIPASTSSAITAATKDSCWVTLRGHSGNSRKARLLHDGGSPIGNSRVKLTNVKDCVKRGLIKEGEDPQKVAADQLIKDGVDVLHTVGGDDTNTAAADLAAFLATNNYGLTVIGLPKTVDNDVYPIKQSLGAWTAAEQGACYFQNVVAENNANPRMLIVHEVMGRNCGWLTAATALEYRKLLDRAEWLPAIGLGRPSFDIHAVFIPEMEIDIAAEAKRLRALMDQSTTSTSSSRKARAWRRSWPNYRPRVRKCRATPSATSSSTPSTRQMVRRAVRPDDRLGKT